MIPPAVAYVNDQSGGENVVKKNCNGKAPRKPVFQEFFRVFSAPCEKRTPT